MAAKCRMLWRNLADEAVLTSPAYAAGFPPVMLQDHDPGMLCKASAVGADLVIEGSWSTPQTCTSLALLRHNLTVAGSITLTTDSGQTVSGKPWLPLYPFGRGPFGQGPIGGYPSARERREMMPMPLAIIYFPQALRFGDFTLTLSNPSNTSALELGRLFLGRHLEAQVNYSWGYGFGFTDPSTEIKLPTGAKRYQRAERLARGTLDFRFIDPAMAYGDFLRLFYVLGKSIPFIIDPEPEGPNSRRFWLRRYVRCLNDPPMPDFQYMHRASFKLSLEEAR
ncbi:MAG: hypothetical protein HY910_12145 [Desulfarculus sp.]|nr:hypothetical protein [Desulfarculus sp.]